MLLVRRPPHHQLKLFWSGPPLHNRRTFPIIAFFLHLFIVFTLDHKLALISFWCFFLIASGSILGTGLLSFQFTIWTFIWFLIWSVSARLGVVLLSIVLFLWFCINKGYFLLLLRSLIDLNLVIRDSLEYRGFGFLFNNLSFAFTSILFR